MEILTLLFSCLVFSLIAYPMVLILQRSKYAPLILLLFIPVGYYLMGLLPISSRRDYFEYDFWIYSIAIIIASVLLGWVFSALFLKNFQSKFIFDSTEFSILPTAGIFLSIVFGIIIIAKFGFLVFNPHQRFFVSSINLYFVELGLCASIFYIAQLQIASKLTIRKLVLIVFVMAVIMVTTGYRSQLVLLLFGVVLYFILHSVVSIRFRYLINAKMVFLAIFSGFLILSIGYYMRVEFSGGDIYSFKDRIEVFEIFGGEFILPILGIHEYSRENIGVAHSAINRLGYLSNFVDLNNFLWMELLTILPGQSQTATGILGLIVNNSDEVYLTPGVVGGIYISHGYMGIFVYFFLFSCLVKFLWESFIANQNPLVLAFICVSFVYYVHFMFRGIIRPMYFIVLIFSLMIVFGFFKARLNFSKT